MRFELFNPAVTPFLAMVSFAFGIMMIIIWRADPAERGAAYWATALLFGGVRGVFLLLDQNGFAWGSYANDVIFAVPLGFGVLGALAFARRVEPVRQLAALMAAAGIALVAMRFYGLSGPGQSPAHSLISAASFAWISAICLGAWRRDRNRYQLCLAVIFAIWAVAVLPVGFLHGNTTAITVTVLLRAAGQVAAVVTVALMLQARLTGRLRDEIAERSRAERRFQDMIETASDWHWEMDRDMRFTYHSPNILAVSGIPAEQYFGKTREEMFPNAPPSADWDEFKALFRARQPIRKLKLRSTIVHDGRAVVIEVSGKPIYDEAGAFDGYRGTGRDLTLHTTTETALATIVGGIGGAVGSDYFKALVLHLATTLAIDVVYVGRLDEKGVRVRSLAQWCDGQIADDIEYAIAGTPCAQVYSRGLCVHQSGVAERFPDDPDLTRLRVEGYVGVPLLDGSGRPIGHIVLMTHAPLKATSLIETVMRALAPRAAAELQRQAADERLRESEQRFREVLDNMPIGFVLKRGNRFLMANRTYARWTGLSPQEVESMTDLEVRQRLGWSTTTQSKVSASQQAVADSGRPQTWESQLPMAGGKTRIFLGVTFPVGDRRARDVEQPSERIIGVAMSDVTELRELETSLAQAQKMDALGRLAGGIAHDFNNIVGAIAGYARFIAEDARPETSMRQFAERIQSASDRAKDLIQQILAFSRRTELVREPVRLAEVITQAVGLLKPSLPGAAGLEFDHGTNDVTIEADATQLAQVLLNLCLNAYQAMGGRSGSVALRVTTHDAGEAASAIDRPDTIHALADGWARYSVGALAAGRRYACIAVTDAGEGMVPETLGRIFEPFFTTKPKGQGTGLGLPVVHGIVLAHGGAITVESRPGHGTTFRIWLPIAESADVPQQSPAPSVAPAGKGRVLVIDDDDHFGDMIAVCLERLGYETAIVDNPVAALATFNEDPALWDLVLTDQTMPELSGIETIQRIKQVRPHLPCILCTGFGHPTNEETARDAGADAYLTKPVDLAILAQVVAHLAHKDVIDAPARPA